MKKISRLLKISVDVGGILLLLLILFVSINFLRGTSQSGGISTGVYPPPQGETEQISTSPYPAPIEQTTTPATSHQKNFVGPDCLVDKSKKLALFLPEGWHGDISLNLISITNYDPNSLQYDHGKPINIPTDHIKIEVYVFVLDPGQTLDQYLSTQKAQATNQDNTRPALTFSENSPYKLGKYDGVAYAVTDSSGWNSRTITARVNDDKGIAVSIFPADSQAFAEALSILSTLDVSENPICPENSSVSSQVAKFPEELNQTEVETTDFECPQGVTYPGTEAKSSTIDLQMPFPWGQTWIVAGGGSFYGNYHHCNYYNNYYATDWNKPDNDDEDAIVVSVADGVVSNLVWPDCNVGGSYGCYVDVDHASDFRTRYAHLGSVLVSLGVSVETGAVLGRVGNSGTDNYHLHMSFWHLDFVDSHYFYLSQCYNNGQSCPNGEPPYYPQGYRLSPMWSTYGNAVLADGLPYTSINGIPIFLPIVITSQ